MKNQNQIIKSFNSDTIDFQSCVNILEKLDSCDNSYTSVYTKENAQFLNQDIVFFYILNIPYSQNFK